MVAGYSPVVTLNACGGMSDRSVLDPEPAVVGFTSVVSTMRHHVSQRILVEDRELLPSVQLSPLAPHAPVWRYAIAPMRGPLLV